MKFVFKTDQGRIRQHNEDSGGVFENKGGDSLAIVADGMGGHKAGDIASGMSVDLLQEMWEAADKIETPEAAETWFKDSINIVNRKLFKHSQTEPTCKGMGTTLVAAICTDRFTTIANIGDSRCYLLSDAGLQQLTEDHSLVNELVKTGEITKEDAEHHPRKNVLLKALGTEQGVKSDIKTICFEEDNMLLLCSDGLSNKVTEQQMLATLNMEAELGTKADTLIELANKHGGEDNITVIIVEYVASDESGW